MDFLKKLKNKFILGEEGVFVDRATKLKNIAIKLQNDLKDRQNNKNLNSIKKDSERSRRNFDKIFQFFAKDSKIFVFVDFLKNSRAGIILIEFAVAMPVMILLLYYTYDVPKANLWHRKMKFVSTQMVQMIQNIAQNRVDKMITLKDLINVGKIAYLTIFPGDTVIPKRAYYFPFGYHGNYNIFYVKGISCGKATVCWMQGFGADGFGGGGTIEGMYSYTARSSVWCSNVKFLANADPDQIYPNLKIRDGEIKIIVESFLAYHINRWFANGTLCRKKTLKEALGFLIFSPKTKFAGASYSFFHSVIIFTPRPGLFDENPPK